MKKLEILISLSITLILTGCATHQPTVSMETYTTDQKVYRNDYFKLTVKKPVTWYALSREHMRKMTRVGADVLLGDNQSTKKVYDHSIRNSIPLFYFFQHPPGTPVKFNPSIGAIAESIEMAPGIKNGCDYLYHARQLFNNTQLDLHMAETCNTVTVNRASFGYADVTMRVNNQVIKQRYYTCIQGDYALSFFNSYSTSDEQRMLENVLKTLEVSCH